jgi:hypothetical protein
MIVAMPTMTVRPLKDFSGWLVVVLWPEGREEHVSDFETEAAAQAWIDLDSATWVDKARQSHND